MIVLAYDAEGRRLEDRPAPELPLAERTAVVVVDVHPGRFVATVFAALGAGAYPLLLPPGTPRERALRLAGRVGASALVYAETTDASEVVRLSGRALVHAPDANAPTFTHEPGLLACTSGTTTDEPSVYFFSLARARANARAHLASFGLAEANGLVILMPLPLAHSFGFVAGVLAAEALGGTLHATTQLPSPAVLFELVEREVVGLLHTTPTGVRAFTRTKRPAAGRDVGSLRAVGVGSASVLVRDAIELARHFPHAARFATYGLTECGPRVATLDLRHATTATDGSQRPGDLPVPLGRALAGVELTLADSGTDTNDGTDEHEAELLVTTPYLARSRLVGETLVPLDAGVPFRTADRARIEVDATGAPSITLLGRADGVVVRGGTNIYPATVEAVVERVPGVRAACLVGRASPAYGEVPVVVVEREPSDRAAHEDEHEDETERVALERAIDDACTRELSLLERPTSIVFVDTLPRTSLGKIRRGQVRADHGVPHV